MIRAKLEFNMQKLSRSSCPLIAFDEENDNWCCIWTEDTICIFKEGILKNCPLIMVK